MRPNRYPYYIDLHVHTGRYSPCAELLDPFSLDEGMSRSGIHGVVLAEHDVMWPSTAIRELREHLTGGRRVYRGVEVSCREGHFVVIGLETGQGLKIGMPVALLLDFVHQQGGVVVWAHPFRPGRAAAACVDPAEIPDGLDAVEVFSSVTSWEVSRKALALAVDRDWCAVAGSDAHALEVVGSAVTGFVDLPETEGDLAAAIRRGDVMPLQAPTVVG